MSNKLFRLDSDKLTLLLLSIDQAIPAVIYFDTRLDANIDIETVSQLTSSAIPMAKLDCRTQVALLPENSRGYFGEPGLQGHRNGKNFTHRFELSNTDEQSDHIIITAIDTTAGLTLDINIQVDQNSNVFSWSHSLTNTSESTFTLDHLSCPTLPLSLAYDQLTTLHGRWGKEFQIQKSQLDAGRFQIDNRRGRTSHEHFPGFIVGAESTSELQGNAVAAHLAWSGNYRVVIDSLSEHERYFQCGELLLPGEVILEKDQSYTTPILHTTQTNSGYSSVSQNLHQFARNKVLPNWTRTERPVHSNSWEALYFDHDIDKLKALVDSAHDTGAERFILDDGWFMGRRDDTAGLGDWQIDPSVYPDGLHPLVNHVRSKGMQFGLWFEPEMVNPDSELFRLHPEWVLQHQPYPLVAGRNQEVLDLSQSELFDYLFDSICLLVDEYKIDYIKWDMNRDTLNAGSADNEGKQKASQHNQILSVYKLFKQLNDKYPTLEIESCASGGARVDLGILNYTGRVWTSDNIDPIERIHIQRGFSLFFPPEIMGSHIGSSTAHLTGRQTSLDTRAIVALQGQTGFEFDSRKLTEEERKTVQHYTNIYKQNRSWLQDAKLWRLPSIQDCIHSQGLVSHNQSESIWTIASDGSHLHAVAGVLKLFGLDSKAQYEVSCLNNNLKDLAHYVKAMPAWMDNSNLILSGELLMQMGLTLPYLPPQTALLLNCKKVSK